MFEGSIQDDPLKSPRDDPFHNLIPFIQGPIIRTPITKLFAGLVSSQEGPTFCANMEMMTYNCFNQYGYERGLKMCGGYLADLEECRLRNFERMRNDIMREERKRQQLEGKEKAKYVKLPPPL